MMLVKKKEKKREKVSGANITYFMMNTDFMPHSADMG